MATTTHQIEAYQSVIKRVLDTAKAKDYAGYSKFDALNSGLLQTLSLQNPWLRLFWIQLVKECPFHIRPLLGVKTSRNPKGIALFARAYLFLYQKSKDQQYLQQADQLLEWLIAHPSPNQTNLCWGYNFSWQDVPPFFQDKGEPNCVVTLFVAEALIHAYRETGNENYLEAAISIAKFICEDLKVLHETDDEMAISYTLGEESSIVLNIQVMAGVWLVKLSRHVNDPDFLAKGLKLMNYTFHRRTDYNAWYYTDPPGKSPIRHDNYHTGGILDAFLEFQEETSDTRYEDVYWSALEYYKNHLFEKDGAPRWMNDRKFPHDVHGAAQGVITFTKAGRYKDEYRQKAKLIADWSLSHLYRPEQGDFIYRQGRILKWNYSLMRWCNAWMVRALGEYLCS